jgi:hypothetical protein
MGGGISRFGSACGGRSRLVSLYALGAASRSFRGHRGMPAMSTATRTATKERNIANATVELVRGSRGPLGTGIRCRGGIRGSGRRLVPYLWSITSIPVRFAGCLKATTKHCVALKYNNLHVAARMAAERAGAWVAEVFAEAGSRVG